MAVAVDADSSVLVLEGGLSFSEGGVTVRPAVFRYALDLKQPGGTVRTRVARLVKSVKEKSSPVDMVMDRIDKTAHLVVLDARPPRLRFVSLGVDNPQIIDIPLDPTSVITPTAVAREFADTFIIADARDDDNGHPATLLRVQIDAAAKTAKLIDLLIGLEPDLNPLVYPTGVLVEQPGVYLVCDSGVKTTAKLDRAFRLRARPAGLFRIRLDRPEGPITITPLATRGELTRPTKMARDPTGTIIVTDQGETDPDDTDSETLPWRGRSHRFGVSVLFSVQSLPPDLFGEDEDLFEKIRPETSKQLRAANRGVQVVIERQKPVHSIQVWKSST